MAMNALLTFPPSATYSTIRKLLFSYSELISPSKHASNSLMWRVADGSTTTRSTKNGERCPTKTIGGYWPLLAEIPNEERSERLIAHLKDPSVFGTQHPLSDLGPTIRPTTTRGHGL